MRAGVVDDVGICSAITTTRDAICAGQQRLTVGMDSARFAEVDLVSADLGVTVVVTP